MSIISTKQAPLTTGLEIRPRYSYLAYVPKTEPKSSPMLAGIRQAGPRAPLHISEWVLQEGATFPTLGASTHGPTRSTVKITKPQAQDKYIVELPTIEEHTH